MQPTKLMSYPKQIVLTVLVIILAIALPAMTQPATPTEISNIQYPIPNIQHPTPNTQPAATSTTYVPLTLRNWPVATHAPRIVLGTQFAPSQEELPDMYADVVEYDLPLVRRAGFTSIRTHVYWRDIEPANTTPDNFDWSRYDQRLRDYREHELDPILSIIGYPGWATRYSCGGGLLAGMAPEWGEFVRAAAERYSRPPFNVHVWEIGNEVDGKTEVWPEDAQRPPGYGYNEPTWPFGGCWGDMASEYVEFLRIAYEEIKTVDPTATVMLGGLAYAAFEEGLFIRDFFEDFVAAGGAAYTDVVGFHWFKLFQPAWPTAVDKARELREIMAAYGVHKPVWLTETWMPDRILDTDFRQERYKFITQDLPRALGSGEIDRVYWYGFSDWPEGWSDFDRGLVTRDHQPKPGLKLFEILTEFVDGIPSPVELPGVEAYRFRRPWRRDENWVLWSTTGETQTVTLPALGTTATAIRIEMGDSYVTTRPILVDTTFQDGEISIPVGPNTVFVRIRRGDQ